MVDGETAVQIKDFVSALIDMFRWFDTAHRDFPWRRTRDPWKVLVAEILLQRTHATKVEEVYRTFHGGSADAAVVDRADRGVISETVKLLGFGNNKT
jgi:A/G-specific adenine glycosylase